MRRRPGLIVAALFSAVLAGTPARAFDPNTFEALVIIEPDEEGFIFIGKNILRHLKPGWHNKMPFIEQVGVIKTTPARYESVSKAVTLSDRTACEAALEIDYVIGDARRAFKWRQDTGRDIRQQREMFSTAREDYVEPARRGAAALDAFMRGLTVRQSACGADKTWQRLDPAGLRGTINADGTKVTEILLDLYCDRTQPVACRAALPVSRSSFSSAPGSRRHR